MIVVAGLFIALGLWCAVVSGEHQVGLLNAMRCRACRRLFAGGVMLLLGIALLRAA